MTHWRIFKGLGAGRARRSAWGEAKYPEPSPRNRFTTRPAVEELVETGSRVMHVGLTGRLSMYKILGCLAYATHTPKWVSRLR